MGTVSYCNETFFFIFPPLLKYSEYAFEGQQYNFNRGTRVGTFVFLVMAADSS